MPTILLAESTFSAAARAELERVGEVVPFERFEEALPGADAIVAGLVLALDRNVPWAFDSLKAGRWERARYGGHELAGKTIGLVGYGRLGRMVAGYARALGMDVVANDPYVEVEDAEAVSLEDLLRRADVVSIHCTFSEETRGLLGERELALVKPSA